MFAIILLLALTIDTESAPPPECAADSVLCSDGETCILEEYICDAHHDCPGGTDEINCAEHTCIEGYTKCSNGRKCIHDSWICDGANDCPDVDDEENCEGESAPTWITAQHDVSSKFDTDCDLKVVTAGRGSPSSPTSRGGPPSGRNWNGNVKFLVDDQEMLLIGLHPKRGKLAVRNNVFRRGTLMPTWDYRWVEATYPEADDEGKREYTFEFTPTGFVVKCADMILITIPYDELTDDEEEFLSSINSVKFELKLSPDKGPISLQYARMCQDTEQPLFALVDLEGSDIEGEQLGLLLYKGGTVCDDGFDTTAANAICKYMGYTASTSWTTDEIFNIQSDYEINLDNVDCSSEEWESCSFSVDHNCAHSEDVFLSCNSEEEEENPTDTEQPLFTLVDSEGSDIEGEQLGLLLYKGGTVCDDDFDMEAGGVICRLMGYSYATQWTNTESFDIQTDYDIRLDDVYCRSWVVGEWGSCTFTEDHNCKHIEDVFLSCNY